MRNLRVLRKIKNQTRSRLRAMDRKNAKELMNREEEILSLERQLNAARRRPVQKIPIPAGFGDRVLASMSDFLAQGLAKKVAEEVPELAEVAHTTARYMAEGLRKGMSINPLSTDSIMYTVEESLSAHQVRFTLSLDGVDINRSEDVLKLKVARDMRSPYPSDESVYRHRRLHTSTRDLQNY